MSLEAIIRTKMGATVALTDICGNRMYPNKAPQDTQTDYLVYRVVDEIPTRAAGTTSNTVNARVQIDFYSNDYDRMVAGKKVIEDTLNRWPLSESVPSIDGISLADFILEISRKTYEDDLQVDRVLLEFIAKIYRV